MSLRESMKKLEAYRLEKKQRDEECRKKESEEATEKEQALLPPKPSLVSRVAARLRVDIFDILPFRMWRSFCNSNPRLCWTATFVVWAVLQCFMAWMEFGAVFFIVFLLTLMILNLGTRAEGEVSAYSVFNPGCERLLGQMTAEHFENELLRRNQVFRLGEMSEAPNFVLYEHAVGYALLSVSEFEDIGRMSQEVELAIGEAQRFCTIVKMAAFDAFKNTEAALDNCLAVSEGIVHDNLGTFLDENLPKKRKKVTLGVNDGKLAGSISEKFPGIKISFTGVVPEIVRGVKFDVHRVDNMVIQSIALLDQLDKDINLFGMRIREWYSYHYPELYKVVPDQYKYVKCASVIMDRKTINEETNAKLMEIMEDEEKVNQIIEAARTSMGMDISEMDLMNIERFANRVASLTDYRHRLHEYIKDRMNSCAPSLSALIGEQVGARLISHAGSLTNLAKYPASTIQILGAEKALFRALKTRSNTPKYGLLFHSSFIGRASAKNKGRISRFLANKCTIASRIDCFSEVPVPTFGEHLRQQVEDRLKFFEDGEVPKKNVEVMKEAADEAEPIMKKILKKKKKAAKKALETSAVTAEAEPVAEDGESKKKKKKRKSESEANGDATMEVDAVEEEKPKKKKKKVAA
ncbi:hypothetical protein QR680_005687 [Steinernema hermaphroditum]|uniref:Nucleolar protein 56 n=1 Tax=Steinernema hermaphroditum TaxID=289476 RepID=A0AA39LVC7_9BILA|nr:hypothetical protein QR680_005687 [Steinernema hermaphroditum]